MSKYQFVAVVLSLAVAMGPRAMAEDALEFSLDEVDASNGSGKAKGKPPSASANAAAVDPKPEIEKALGELRWGLSKADVVKLLKARVRVEFEQRVKVERDILRQDSLYREAQERAQRVSENYVSFDGQKTGWDVSPIRAEFTHGNRESMMVVTGNGSRDLYFFIQDKLWKWYRELTPAPGEAQDPDRTLAALEQRLGPGKTQKERRSESNMTLPGKSWTDGTTRVTTLRRGNDACVVYEDLATLSQLGVLRYHVQPKQGRDRAAAAVNSILLSEAELEARSR